MIQFTRVFSCNKFIVLIQTLWGVNTANKGLITTWTNDYFFKPGKDLFTGLPTIDLVKAEAIRWRCDCRICQLPVGANNTIRLSGQVKSHFTAL